MAGMVQAQVSGLFFKRGKMRKHSFFSNKIDKIISKKTAIFLLVFSLNLAGCSAPNNTVSSQGTSSQQTEQQTVEQKPQTQSFDLPKETLPLIFFERDCALYEHRIALPMTGICPQKNKVSEEDVLSYSKTESINSPEYGYANIRSVGDFDGNENLQSILVTLSHGQKFCSGGYVLTNNSDGGQEGFAYYVLLQDSKKQYCRGLVWEGLVKK